MAASHVAGSDPAVSVRWTVVGGVYRRPTSADVGQGPEEHDEGQEEGDAERPGPTDISVVMGLGHVLAHPGLALGLMTAATLAAAASSRAASSAAIFWPSR